MIVVGAGVNGIWAALVARRYGLNVTVFDPFLENRSSESGSRHINTWWSKPKAEVQAVGVRMWDELLQQGVEMPIVLTDCLQFVDDEARDDLVQCNVRNGQKAEVLSPAQIFERFGVTHESDGVFLEGLSRMMDMKPSLEIMRAYAKEEGVKFAEESVTGISQNTDRCVVSLANGKSIDTDYVAVCAGPWMKKILAEHVHVPLLVTQQQYCVFRDLNGKHSAENRWPLIEDDLAFDGQEYYTKPSVGTCLVKVALDDQGPELDPDQNGLPEFAEQTNAVREYAKRRYGNSLEYVGTEFCRYTLTPDWGLISDFVPGMTRVCFTHNCGGGGCKSAPAFAEVMLRMLLQKEQEVDVSHFSLEYHKLKV